MAHIYIYMHMCVHAHLYTVYSIGITICITRMCIFHELLYVHKLVHVITIRGNHPSTYHQASDMDVDDESRRDEGAEKKGQKNAGKPIMKKPAGKVKKWDWDSDDGVSEEEPISVDDEDIRRDHNDAAWFKDVEHLLTKDHK
jgi:hypothetical protein